MNIRKPLAAALAALTLTAASGAFAAYRSTPVDSRPASHELAAAPVAPAPLAGSTPPANASPAPRAPAWSVIRSA